VLARTGPNWLGSPQHVVVGAILAVVVYGLARWQRLRLPEWETFAIAVGVVSTAEILLELAEYPLLYADKFHYSAYYDTLADMASSVVGAVIGTVIAVFLPGVWPISLKRRSSELASSGLGRPARPRNRSPSPAH
jgi:hypothetical protein